MNLLHRIPFALRVPLFTAAMMILVGFLASQQVLSTLRQVQDTRIRELAQLQVEALSVALGPLVSRHDVWEVYDTLVRATGKNVGRKEGHRLVFAAVANPEGAVLAATDPHRAPVDSQLRALTDGAQDLHALSVNGERRAIKVLAPLVYQGREVGQILTEMDVSDLIAERQRVSRYLLIGNALATGLLAVFGYLVMRRMLKPVTRVIERMRESADAPEPIAAADMPVGDNEMTELANSYNTMVGAIGAKAEADRRLAERERLVSLGRLSSSLAHEINNPLGGLINAVDTLQKYADRPEVVRESTALLKRGLNHMRDVARATLNLDRLDHEGAILSIEDFRDLKLLIEPEISRRQQKLGWDVGEKIDCRLPAAHVRQIALNLLLNATEAAGPEGRVALKAHAEEGQLFLDITDSGPGLSKAACARLMGEGERIAGGGVGLRLVHDLVTGLKGRISCQRIEGETIIRVELPCCRE